MLVSLITRNARGSEMMSNTMGIQRGFDVKSDTTHWTNVIRELQTLNRNPDENAVMEEATMAGESSVAKVLFQDYTNYRLERATNYASMAQTEMNAMSRFAGLSQQLSIAQDKMTQQFAASAYQIGKSYNYTQGIANAYAQGLQVANGVM